jgi:MscS family membrane protein
MNQAIDAWRRGALDEVSDRASMSAMDALDFSMTPHSSAWSVRIERALLLKEILDRIELPPAEEIPGDDEVADGTITEWIIPDTRITIARIEDGPRAGEFLFSAATVQRLATFYKLAKDLPYKPEASLGFYEAWVRADSTVVALEKRLRNRLKQVEHSSPQATLEGFLDSVNRAHGLIMEANAALEAEPPTMTKEEALEIETTARNLLKRAAGTLDLRQVPKAHREDDGLEAVLLLKEILDRTFLPLLEAVPDAQMVEAARKRVGWSSSGTAGAFRWRYPNTEIEIVEIMKGEQQGEFLFSARTVGQIHDYYQKVRDLPYTEELSQARAGKYVWSGVSEGFYDHYISTPGYLIPRAHFLGRLVDDLPDSLETLYSEQTAWQWIGLLLCVLGAALAAYLVFRIMKLLAGRLSSPLDDWLGILAPATGAVIVMAVHEFIDDDLNVTGQVLTAVTAAGKAIIAVMTIWAAFRLCRAVAETIIASPKIPDESVDASLLRISARVLGVLIGAWIAVEAVQHLGADVIPLLAGLGVGGLAVALAAQKTVANFLGSLILFANKPVKVGDFCRYGDQIGTVEHIGLLSTRIRSLERTIITVPNAEFSEMQLDNFAMRDQRLLRTRLQLRYETTPEQMRYVLAKLRELLLGHPMVTPDPARVRFVGYGAYSKDVEVFAYLHCQEQNDFLAIQEDVLLRVEDIINEAGTGFAFPSQTAYLTPDTGLDAERGAEAEAQVEGWRGSGTLPFPDFENQEREQLEDILDYPPQGSPDHEPPEASPDQQPETASSALSAKDLFDVPLLAAKLQEAAPVARYLLGRLSAPTQELVSNYTGGSDAELREALVQDLNAIVLGPSIYDEDRFSEVELRQQTRELLDRDPEGEDLARLNRLLLEDAYPQELSKVHS